MKSVVLLAAVGVTSVPMCILAQDVSIWTDPFGGTVTIHYNGTLRISQLWSDISVRITGDAPITITNQSLNYTDGLSPNGAVITGNGTNEVTFVGTAGGPLFGGTHTPVNSWEPFTFSYDGSYSAFHFELFGQNTCMFIQASLRESDQHAQRRRLAGPTFVLRQFRVLPGSELGCPACVRRRCRNKTPTLTGNDIDKITRWNCSLGADCCPSSGGGRHGESRGGHIQRGVSRFIAGAPTVL